METLSATRVYTDRDVVSSMLERQFELSINELFEVAEAIFRAFTQVSGLHPKGFNGTAGWADGIASLRNIMIPKGWATADPQGQPRVVSKDKSLAITLSSGNAFAGVAGGQEPQTRNDKGAQTASSVIFNKRQFLLFPASSAGEKVVSLPSNGQALWIFLYFIDFDARELRYELSQPTGMSDAEKVNGWAHRLILPAMRFNLKDDLHFRDDDDDDSAIDFDVTPKAF